MTPQEHQRVKEIFLKACDLPNTDRASYLHTACSGDQQLVIEVSRLLAKHLEEPIRAASEPEPSPASGDGHTLETGKVVAGRYRIVSMLGEGGMGRVYRAEDLVLNETIALKFFPAQYASDPEFRQRFESEVRLARRLTHPYLCRVHDIGECDGVPILSMEYIDGEDLRSLLKRVGRLTGPRAVEIGRQICVGLAAAHACSVLHRDLKPANVMLDNKGKVRITDFGLAAVAGTVQHLEIRSGTPRYMAPEQISGEQVDERSDIYSLGLILYEMFCGSPAFVADSLSEYRRLHSSGHVVSPSQMVPDLNPAIESVILSCLEKKPANRPDSALVVAAALPGGDILSAAIDAGQVPSPTMIAESHPQTQIRRRTVTVMFVAAVLLELLVAALATISVPAVVLKGSLPPDALAERAREYIRLSGHLEPTAHATYGFAEASELSHRLAARMGARRLGAALSAGPLFYFQAALSHPGPIETEVLPLSSSDVQTRYLRPAGTDSVTLILRPDGRLIRMEVEESLAKAGPNDQAEPDWNAWVSRTGLDASRLTRSDPIAAATVNCDHRAALILPQSGGTSEVRIEAGASHERVVFVEVSTEGDGQGSLFFEDAATRRSTMRTFRQCVLLMLLTAALPVAWNNWRRGSIDVQGAIRLGGFVSVLRLCAAFLSTRGGSGFSALVDGVVHTVANALCEGMIVALFYVALEQYARRFWSHSLVGWTRILRYQALDASLAREALIGCIVGFMWAMLVHVEYLTPAWLGWNARGPLSYTDSLDHLLSSRLIVATACNWLRNGIYYGLMLLLLLVLARVTVKRPAASIVVAWLIASAMFVPVGTHPLTAWTFIGLGGVAVAIFILVRFGLVGAVVASFVNQIFTSVPITADLSAWYAGRGMLAILFTTLLVIGLHRVAFSNRFVKPA